MRILLISYLIFIHEKLSSCNSICRVSVPTLKSVQSCPTTKQGLQSAVIAKDCQSLAELQNCTEKKKFKYHCILSSTKTILYEVCAPEIISLGYCVGYDVGGQGLQMLFQDRCSNETDEKCPINFSSGDLLKYSFCQKRIVNSTESSTPSLSTYGNGTMNTSVIGKDSTTAVIGLVFAAIAIPLFGIGVIILVQKGKMRLLWNSWTRCDRQDVAQNADVEDAVEPFCSSLDNDQSNKVEGRDVAQNADVEDTVEPLCSSLDNDQSNKVHVEERMDESSSCSSNSSSGDKQQSFKYEYDASGFDEESIEKVIKDFHLESMGDLFKKNDIDCIQTFISLDGETLESLGMSTGKKIKCLQAIERIGFKSNSRRLQSRQINRKEAFKDNKTKHSDTI